jgi:hypothetical protein
MSKAAMWRTLVAAFLVLPAACAGTSRFADAVVTERDTKPCFAPSDVAAMRTLQAVVVYDQSTAPPTAIWTVLIDPKREADALTGCVAYGQAFASQPGAQPPSALVTGRIYEVVLNAPPANAADPTRGYRAQFCLVREPGGSTLRIRQVRWDKRLSKWQHEICEVPAPQKP